MNQGNMQIIVKLTLSLFLAINMLLLHVIRIIVLDLDFQEVI